MVASLSAPHQNLCSRSLAGSKRRLVTAEIAGSNPVGCENILVRGHERKPARLDRKAVGRVEGSNPFGPAFGRRSALRRAKPADGAKAPFASQTKFRMHYVYVLRCVDGQPYTGCSNDLRDRIRRHQKGLIPATKDRLPVELVSYFAFRDKYTAYNFEKYLKSGSGRAFLKRRLV